MTPLAHSIAKAICEDRLTTLPGEAGQYVFDILGYCHFFEVSGIGDAARAAITEADHLGPFLPRAFLPATSTWLEWIEEGARYALVLSEDHRQPLGARDIFVALVDGWGKTCVPVGIIPLSDPQINENGEMAFTGHPRFPYGEELNWQMLVWTLGLLFFINTPTLLAPRKHHPHAGLAKIVARRGFMGGKFPLQGWTEIILKPGAVVHGKGREGASADRCLHFVRRHAQRYGGTWKVKDAYWRGDASLGIRLSRYLVEPSPENRA